MAQVSLAGSAQAQMMAKLEKNTDYLKTNALIMKLMTGLYLLLTVLFPVQCYSHLFNAYQSGFPQEWLIFIGAMIFSAFFLSQLGLILMFGVYFSAGVLSGTGFAWLATLPIDRRSQQKIIMYTFYRSFDFQLWIMMLILPISTAIVTRNIIMVGVAILLSVLNIVLIFIVLVFVGERLSRNVKDNSANTAKQTTKRMLFMIAVILTGMAMLILIQLGLPYVVDMIYVSQPPFDPTLFNQYLPVIPYPVNLGYLLTKIFIYFSNN